MNIFPPNSTLQDTTVEASHLNSSSKKNLPFRTIKYTRKLRLYIYHRKKRYVVWSACVSKRREEQLDY